jgi:hypothetical protein
MKKLFVFVLFAISVAAQAQAVTEKDLEGSWELVGLNDGDVILDFEKGTAKLTEESAEGLSRREIKEEEADVEADMEDYKYDYPVTFTAKGNQVRIVLDGEEQVGTFTIQNGNTMILVFEGGEDVARIELKGKKLVLINDEEEVTLTYKKI